MKDTGMEKVKTCATKGCGNILVVAEINTAKLSVG